MNRGRASAAKTAQATDERRALKMRRDGASYEAIGDALGITASGAFRMVKRVLAQAVAETKHDASEVVELELQRLDELWTFARDAMQSGDVGAIDKAVRIMERRAKLLGLDAASKSEVSGPDGGPVTLDVVNGLRTKLARLAEPDATGSADREPEPGGGEGA